MRGVIAPPAANRHPDALIVGAGPAGSSLAWRLASAGARVLLIDATAFPRSKPCGDALSPGATPFLREMGVVRSLRDAGAHSLRGWRIQAPSGRWFEGRFAAPRAGVPRLAFAVPRSELDALLLDAALRAGVHFLPSARAFDLVTAEDGRALGVRVRLGDGSARELRARLVVGADGLRSVVARRLGGVRRGDRARLAIVGRFEGTRVDGRLGVMHVSGEGCLGMAPLGGGRCNITVVVPMAAAGRVSTNRWGFYRERLRRYSVWEKVSDGKLSERLQITGPFEVSPRRVVGPGALLVGDAAGYFDPFTGQGIYRALYTAQLAARAVLGALERPAEESAWLARYEEQLRRLLRPGRWAQRLVDAVVSRPPLLDATARLMASYPGLADLLVDVTGDRLPAAALLDPRRLWRGSRDRAARPATPPLAAGTLGNAFGGQRG
ncbi:MAG: NAD(P)/FAD-dependent oxidoreductase [Gemmatimonadota bacterium]